MVCFCYPFFSILLWIQACLEYAVCLPRSSRVEQWTPVASWFPRDFGVIIRVNKQKQVYIVYYHKWLMCICTMNLSTWYGECLQSDVVLPICSTLSLENTPYTTRICILGGGRVQPGWQVKAEESILEIVIENPTLRNVWAGIVNRLLSGLFILFDWMTGLNYLQL